jgi:hypothetical protein
MATPAQQIIQASAGGNAQAMARHRAICQRRKVQKLHRRGQPWIQGAFTFQDSAKCAYRGCSCNDNATTD